MHRSTSGLSPKAIGWALLSQVFWVPLLAIDLHDRWVARQREVTPPGQALPPSPIARATPFSLNDLLGAARPVQQLAGQANQVVSGALGSTVRGATSGVGVLLSSAGSSASSLLDRPFTVSLDTPAAPASAAGGSSAAGPQVAPLEGLGMLGRAFTRAQLLGGSISLADLQEGPMAPLALAERALQRGSGDPLAPLPSLWREPMRQALLKLPGAPQQLNPARLVYVPSSSVSQPLEVPLALQSDGSVDILQAPANAAVLREIDSWSRQQRPPASGSLLPAIVHLHPLPAVAPLTPAASASRPAAAAPRGTASAAATAPRPAASATPAASASAAEVAPLPLRSQAPARVAARAETIPVPLRSEDPSASIPVPILSETPAAADVPVAAAPPVEAPAPVAEATVAEAATIPVPITSEAMPAP